jgi:FKBP-type peptidyl-prolyl cis-trans isomerase FkpA
MKKVYFFLLLGVASVSRVFAQQEQRLADGALCTIVAKHNGPKIKEGDIITFNIEQRTQGDSVLFSSYAAGKPAKTRVRASQGIMDLMSVFTQLSEKDSALVKLPVDSLIKGHEAEAQAFPFLKKGAYLITRIKIEKVQSVEAAMAEEQAEAGKLRDAETAAAAKYIADNKLNVQTTATGLKYLITKPSVKAKPKNGDTLLVNYAGKTLDGKVFDSSIEAVAKQAQLQQPGRNYEPIEVVLGEGRVIPGWEQGLALLGEGAKAMFIIPSSLGYGERGSPPVIMPFSTLVFDIELVKIKPGKHLPAKPASPALKKPVAKKKATAAKPEAKKKN